MDTLTRIGYSSTHLKTYTQKCQVMNIDNETLDQRKSSDDIALTLQDELRRLIFSITSRSNFTLFIASLAIPIHPMFSPNHQKP